MQIVIYIASKTPINSGRQIFGTGNIYAEYVYPRNMNLIKKVYKDFFLCFLCCFITLLKLSFWSKSRADEKSWPEAYFGFKHNIESRKRLDKQTILIRICSVIILKDNYRSLDHFERGKQSNAFVSHFVARNEK